LPPISILIEVLSRNDRGVEKTIGSLQAPTGPTYFKRRGVAARSAKIAESSRKLLNESENYLKLRFTVHYKSRMMSKWQQKQKKSLKF
jgi:hypothetical protein